MPRNGNGMVISAHYVSTLARGEFRVLVGSNSMWVLSIRPVFDASGTQYSHRGLSWRVIPSPRSAKGELSSLNLHLDAHLNRKQSIALGSATNVRILLLRNGAKEPSDRRCSHLQWVWNFLLSFFAPRIAARIGPLILLIFFGCLVFGFFYVLLFVPEVKGLSLEEVDELYRANIKPWQSAGWKPAAHMSRHVGNRRVVNGEIIDDDDDSAEANPPAEKAVDDEKQPA